MVKADEVRKLLSMLAGQTADAIESETLECKSWSNEPAAWDRQIRELREATVGFANAGGGTIVLGVVDRSRTRAKAIQGVGALDPERVRRAIYDGTDPHILVQTEDLIEPEGRLLLIHVPRGIPPHTTTEGTAKIRVGKRTMPLTGSNLVRLLAAGGQGDRTAETVAGATFRDLDPDQIGLLRREIQTEGENPDLARLPPAELLQALDLVRDRDVTVAALLLVGTRASLARWVPQHEVVFLRFRSATRYDVRHDLRIPALQLLARLAELLKAHLRMDTVLVEGFREVADPELPAWTAREAVLNAIVHRDYFQREGIQVSLHPDRLEIASPGGFIGGVTPDNILRHPPVRRNPLLASALQTIGFVNRAGLGVDRMFSELLEYGKPPPSFESDESHVRVVLPSLTRPSFRRFVASEVGAGRTLGLEELLLLRLAADRGRIDRWSAGRALQTSEEEAARRLSTLKSRGYLTATGRGRATAYSLAPHMRSLRPRPGESIREPDRDEAGIRRRLLATLALSKRLSNRDAREQGAASRADAIRILRALVREGWIVPRGRGRGAHYAPGPKAKDLVEQEEPAEGKG